MVNSLTQNSRYVCSIPALGAMFPFAITIMIYMYYILHTHIYIYICIYTCVPTYRRTRCKLNKEGSGAPHVKLTQTIKHRQQPEDPELGKNQPSRTGCEASRDPATQTASANQKGVSQLDVGFGAPSWGLLVCWCCKRDSASLMYTEACMVVDVLCTGNI